MRLLKQVGFIRHTIGAAHVELALIAVPLFILIIGTVQNVLVSVARLSLDSNLQALTYEAANEKSQPTLFLLTKHNLCARRGFYLVDCQSGSDFCFSVIALDRTSISDIANLNCNSGSSTDFTASGTFAVIAEYPIPNLIAMPDLLSLAKIVAPRRLVIRSVALYYTG